MSTYQVAPKVLVYCTSLNLIAVFCIDSFLNVITPILSQPALCSDTLYFDFQHQCSINLTTSSITLFKTQTNNRNKSFRQWKSTFLSMFVKISRVKVLISLLNKSSIHMWRSANYSTHPLLSKEWDTLKADRQCITIASDKRQITVPRCLKLRCKVSTIFSTSLYIHCNSATLNGQCLIRQTTTAFRSGCMIITQNNKVTPKSEYSTSTYKTVSESWLHEFSYFDTNV